MFQDRIWYELRILGRRGIFIPPLIILTFAILAVVLLVMHVSHLSVSQIVTASLEMILPLAAGLMTSTIVSYDSAIELQITMPTTYRLTAFLRLSLIIVWISFSTLISSAFVYHLRFWRIPSQGESWKVLPQFLIGQLTWIAPLLWFLA